MKYRVLFAAVVLSMFAVGIVTAQDINVGVKGGAVASLYGGSDWNDFISDLDDIEGVDVRNEPYVGFGGSLFLEIGLMPNLSIQPEIGFARRGGGFMAEGEFEGESEKFTALDYFDMIDIPLFLKPKLPLGFGAVYGLLGPQMSLIVGDGMYELELEVNGETDSASGTFTPDNTLLFGAAAGAGITVDLGPVNVLFDLVYFRTFTSPFEEEEEIGGIEETFDPPIINSFSGYAGLSLSF